MDKTLMEEIEYTGDLEAGRKSYVFKCVLRLFLLLRLFAPIIIL